MSFLNPTYLWTLLGLALPILIHIWNKKEGKTLKVGSIKLLSETDSSQTSSIKINELVLLFIRLILISLVAFILVEPQFKWNTQNAEIVYIIEPSLLLDEKITTIIDNLQTDEPLRFLLPGFPEAEISTVDTLTTKAPNYWQLAKDMEQIKADSIVILTKGLLSGIRGMRPEINNKIEWIIIDSEERTKQLIKATQKENQIQLISVHSNSQGLSFKQDNLSQNSNSLTLNSLKDSVSFALNGKQIRLPISNKNPIKILLFYEDSQTNEMHYIEAAFNALSKHLNHTIELTKTDDLENIDQSEYNAIVWLSEKPAIQTDATLITYKPDKFAQSIIEPGLSNKLYHLTQSLNAENIIEDHLPERLLEALNLNENLNSQISRYDNRIVDRLELLPKKSTLKVSKTGSSNLSISKWLWLILLGILITERIFANYRKQ